MNFTMWDGVSIASAGGSESFTSISGTNNTWSYRSSLLSDESSIQSLHAQPGDFKISRFSSLSHALDESGLPHRPVRFIFKSLGDFRPVGALCGERALTDALRVSFSLDLYRSTKKWFQQLFSSLYKLAVERRAEEVDSLLGSRVSGVKGYIEKGMPTPFHA